MSITSYSELQASMKRWIKRADLADLFPDFIMLAEKHFGRNIFTRARRTTFKITPSKPVVSLPADWARVIQVYYGGSPLDPAPTNIESAYAGGSSHQIASGYQIIGDSLSLSVAQLGQVLQLDYYTVIEPLSETNTSNWLLEDGPDVYLFGALHEAAMYMRDDARATLWMQKRDAAIDELVTDDEKAKTADQPLRMRTR
ncbi:hypothetical protein WJ60_09820 [Burkholderia ubonensis]|uniref:phage adaptor protein n=1 Tax=Burkholderia ubonensis TaxID=101571 RepID=UPI000758006D|nr:hypothetical protein [Burkholderia ubonensis]KVM70124.1 hypothetical protein WJ60_09820 [Burkholderia ubonensis]